MSKQGKQFRLQKNVNNGSKNFNEENLISKVTNFEYA